MKNVIVFGVLLLLLGAAIWAAVLATGATDDEVTGPGWVATIIGVLGSVGLGVALMVLVFVSNRRGYDDRVDEAARVSPPDPTAPPS
jgi:hypothetical protein